MGTRSFTLPKAESGNWVVRQTSSGSGMASHARDWLESGEEIGVR